MSDNVVSIVEQVQHNRTVERLARLWGLVGQRAEELRKNPDPFLAKAAEQYCALERQMEEIRRIVYPSPVSYEFDPRVPITDLFREAFGMVEAIRWIV